MFLMNRENFKKDNFRKYVLVTGASRGIGRSTALLFAENGYHVFLNCCRSAREIEEVKKEIDSAGRGSCEIVMGDVGNPRDVNNIFEKIGRTCGRLHVLVNNAGISHIGLLSDMSDSQWDAVLRTNLSSVFYCCRAAIPGMVAKKQGRIINESPIPSGSVSTSCAGWASSRPRCSPVAAAEAARSGGRCSLMSTAARSRRLFPRRVRRSVRRSSPAWARACTPVCRMPAMP